MDELLMWIVNNVERGTLKNASITIAVPGGIFAGDLIPTWQYVEMMGRAVRGEDYHRGNGGGAVPGGTDVPQNPVENPECLHLLGPLVLSASQPFTVPALRVRIDSIAAWTSMSMPDE